MTTAHFFRSKPLWVGIILAGGIDVVNGLHFLFPNFPGLGGEFYDLRPTVYDKTVECDWMDPDRLLPLRYRNGIFHPSRPFIYILVFLHFLEIRDDFW